jgi:hypothetical protein
MTFSGWLYGGRDAQHGPEEAQQNPQPVNEASKVVADAGENGVGSVAPRRYQR